MTTTKFDMADIRARGLPIQVVAAKLPGEWILRGIGVFKSEEIVTSWMEPFVRMGARTADEIEWSQHRYHVPHYLVYGSGVIVGSGWPETGVFVFRHIGGVGDWQSTYGNAVKLRGSS